MITGVKRAKSLAVVTVLSMSFGAAACSSDTKPATTTAGDSTETLIKGVKTYSGLSRDHTTDPVTYPQSPPVGGNHDPVWQNCGVYDEPIKNEHAVHSLEHGAVWITYRPDLPAAQIAVLAGFAVNQSHILVSPYPGLTTAVVVTAWGVQLSLESVVDPRLAQFVAEYQEGPQTPELGVTCSGGFGDPIA
jgi:hypothetical protein